MAHRLVLVAHSKVLYAIIGADQNCNYVSLDHLSIPGDVISNILDFLYTGVIRLLPNQKLPVLEAARALDIPSLTDILDPPVVKRKRGRPRKGTVVMVASIATKVKKAKVAVPIKAKKAVVNSSSAQRRKRGRPRKCDVVSYAEVDEVLNEEVEVPPEPVSDGEDYAPDGFDNDVNDDDDDVDGEDVLNDKDDLEFKPKASSPSVKRRKTKDAKGKRTSLLKVKKPKKILTLEEMENKRIELEKKRNRRKLIISVFISFIQESIIVYSFVFEP